MAEKAMVKISDVAIEINYGDSTYQFLFCWLRDHCRCEECFNSVTQQRRLDIGDISLDIKPVEFSSKSISLNIQWQDGHISVYSLDWLREQTYEKYLKKITRNPVLWTAEDVKNLPVAHVAHKDLISKSDGVFALVKSLVDYGVGFVEEVPADIASTEEVVRKVSHVQHTLFGGMWEFSDAAMDHSDTAYTSEALGAHTDNTYFTEAAGLQILHCLHHSGTGGENLLVDGFKVVQLLKENHPDVFERLSATLVEAEYREDGMYHTNLGPIIRLNQMTKQVEQIRFNMNDRAPVAYMPTADILQHYKDLQLLSKLFKDPTVEWWFKLRPGTVLFFDNFRTLHGRSAYTGHRTMCGCYVGRGDFLSKARVLGLL